MNSEKIINPILKWAGGKRQLIPELKKYIPTKFNKYIEPFFGGGALFFHLAYDNSIINDNNPEIINLYQEVSKRPKLIIEELEKYKNNEKFFYALRNSSPKTSIKKAARTIFLNRTCFNGLYRVNKKGQFNVPYGKSQNINFVDKKNLLLASKILKKTKIYNLDYKFIMQKFCKKKDFVFLDPPYLPISKYSDFKRYTKEQFHLNDHIELSEHYKELDKKGCYLILTNSNNEIINKLYREYKIRIIKTKRNINSNGLKRTGEDIIITNF
jgi:DNA adenine methylase